ncbi:MAG: response regulator [Candidatus Odinarchaeota archaeon]
MITSSILIVDDDREILLLYQKMLEHIGFEVVGTANNGEEAVQLFKSFQRKPDIILMDHRMPKKNGVEATKEILSISNHSKIIFTSADNSIKKEALSVGAVTFLKKPFSIEKLRQSILNVINSTP